MHLTSPPSAALHAVKLPLCINSKVCFGVLLMYFLEMHHRNFMLISRWRPSFLAPLPLALSPSRRPSRSLSLSASVFFSAGGWAAPWGPADKCGFVSRDRSWWPVVGSYRAAPQARLCHRCHSGPCGHLLRPHAWHSYTGGRALSNTQVTCCIREQGG